MNANYYEENEAGRETTAVAAGAQGGPSVELTSELRPAGTLVETFLLLLCLCSIRTRVTTEEVSVMLTTWRSL